MIPDARTRQCAGKVKYLDEEEARKRAKILHKLHKATYNHYLCPWCSFWHTGTNRTRRQQERRTTS